LLIVFSYIKEGGGSTLFALSKVDLVNDDFEMSHYVQPVGDSSRYFVIRVVDEHNGREALVGLGFREREEAADFVQCLTNYQNAIARERLSKGMSMMAVQQ
jgi:adaptin ear-binding coat-associated protein 1/2